MPKPPLRFKGCEGGGGGARAPRGELEEVADDGGEMVEARGGGERVEMRGGALARAGAANREEGRTGGETSGGALEGLAEDEATELKKASNESS